MKVEEAYFHVYKDDDDPANSRINALYRSKIAVVAPCHRYLHYFE